MFESGAKPNQTKKTTNKQTTNKQTQKQKSSGGNHSR